MKNDAGKLGQYRCHPFGVLLISIAANPHGLRHGLIAAATTAAKNLKEGSD